MARTYSKVPEPRYVERAKYADNASGGGGGPEIFEAIAFETTYEEIDTAYNAGKIVLLKTEDSTNYYGGIPSFEGDSYTFHLIDGTGTTLLFIVDSNGWRTETVPEIFWVKYGETPYTQILAAYMSRKLCVLKNAYEGAVLTDSMSGVLNFSKAFDDVIQTISCRSDNTWSAKQYITSSIEFVQPNNDSFMSIVNAVQGRRLPVINDLANGRAYYVSGYTMNGDQPTAITFSTINASDPHTWTVDYQNNWTST